MNTINLIGRLTQDPESRTTPSETTVCTMRLAVQRQKSRDGNDRGAVFVDITCFAGLADVCGEHLVKGRRIGVSGRLEHNQWEAQDGSKRQRHYVVAEAVEFLDQKQNGVEPFAATEPEPDEKPKRSRRKAA